MKYRFGIYLNFTHKKKGGMFFRVLVFLFSHVVFISLVSSYSYDLNVSEL